LTRIEGVDELARLRGVAEPVAELTAAAMEGRVPVESVYGRRLELIRPDRDALDWLGRRYVGAIVEGAGAVVRALHGLGKEVHVVSGGFRPAVCALARALAIPESRVHAVELYFDERGDYVGFDERSPLTRSGGKGRIAGRLLRGGGRGVAIGDGMTDLEMMSAGLGFVGFGGVVRRAPVADRADRYVETQSLSAILSFILTADEQARLLRT
jgi:phosphoserine phosphatase